MTTTLASEPTSFQRRARWAVLLLALALRLLVLIPVAQSASAQADVLDSVAYRGGDSLHYARLAENMVEHGIFSLSAEPPFVPDILRTPPMLLGWTERDDGLSM